MSYAPLIVDTFDGLRLDLDPTEAGSGAAVDLVNVEFDREGRIRARHGNTLVKATGALVGGSGCGGVAAYSTSVTGVPQLILSYATAGPTYNLAAYSASGGAVIATATPSFVLEMDRAAQWGDTSNKRLYIPDSIKTWRWSGAAFSQPAAMPAATHLTVSPVDNRLVAADAASTSKVLFSNAGDPETWGVDDFVYLAPGDGSDIRGLAAWQDKVFAFKANRFFVFGGTSVDADGGAVFNYRPIERFGAIVPPAAGEEGVYFFDGRRVWVTTGDVPRCISAPIEPFLRGEANVNGATGSQSLLEVARLRYSQGRLWFSVYDTVAETTTFIYDPQSGTWTVSDLQITGLATSFSASQPRTYWTVDNTTAATTGLSIYRVDPTVTTDAGTAIAWYYTSGNYDTGTPDRKVIRESELTGTGSVTLRVGVDFGAVDTGSALTLGVSPALAEARQRTSRRGTYFQHKLSGAGGCAVSRLVHRIRDTEEPK